MSLLHVQSTTLILSPPPKLLRKHLKMDGWTETQPHTWTRPFEGIEKLYRGASLGFKHLGKEQWQIYCLCTLRVKAGGDISAALSKAWLQLGLEFPNLTVRPDGMIKVYRELRDADADGLGGWLAETFFHMKKTSLVDDVIKEARGPDDLPRLHHFPGTSQVLFICSHWRVDAIGTCMLLDRLFSLLAGHEPRPSVHDLSPCLEDACGAVPMESCTAEMAQYARDAIAKHHADAVHAALAEAIFALAPAESDGDDASRDFSTVIPVNVRDRLPGPYGGASHACAAYVTGITPVVRRRASFVDRARSLARSYRELHGDMFAKTMRLRYHFHAQKLLEEQPPLTMAPPSGVTLSSLGVVEKHLPGVYVGAKEEPAVEVSDFGFGVSLLTRQMLLYAMTFRGRFRLSLNYNDAYHERASVQRILEHIVEVLEANLGFPTHLYATNETMSWIEVRPGVFRRPAGANEIMIKATGDSGGPHGREHWTITATAKITAFGLASARLSEEMLRAAWVCCRFQHPGIASVFLESDVLEYVVPDERSLQQWVDETFSYVDVDLPKGVDITQEEEEEEEEQDVDILFQQLAASGFTTRPTRYATLHYFEKTGHVVLRISHWRTDAYGAVEILNDLVSLIDIDASSSGTPSAGNPPGMRNIRWGNEAARLPPSVEEALSNPPSPPPPEISSEARRCLDTTGLVLARDATRLNFCGGPSRPPGGTRSVSRRFSRASTDSISQACSRVGVGITAAVHAAVAVTAAQNRRDGDGDGPFVSTIRASLRLAVAESRKGQPAQAAGIYTAGWFVAVPVSASWAEHAALFEREYARPLTRVFLLARRELSRSMDRCSAFGKTLSHDSLDPPNPMAHLLEGSRNIDKLNGKEYATQVLRRIRPADAGNAARKQAPTAPARLLGGLDISSIGHTDALVREFHRCNVEAGTPGVRGLAIDSISLGVDTLIRHVYCFMWVFNGRLELNVVYNEAYYDGSLIQGLASGIVDNLLLGLGSSH
ncbi:hypothetical protein CSOJ01_09949 [Colletotrichum sojae]|uniref:Condensation domain-containing protein n=1 Tax=Colletotrichum sojae TaxID=2175907 RepID=A0A8H6MQS5_9PEZI|nr:hypothetical protein CSOJ01_09949 [Colletotrichum sojae]